MLDRIDRWKVIGDRDHYVRKLREVHLHRLQVGRCHLQQLLADGSDRLVESRIHSFNSSFSAGSMADGRLGAGVPDI